MALFVFDKLKSYTKGYASFDYELIGYKTSDLVKGEIKYATKSQIYKKLH